MNRHHIVTVQSHHSDYMRSFAVYSSDSLWLNKGKNSIPLWRIWSNGLYNFIGPFILLHNCVLLPHCTLLHRNCDVTALPCRMKVKLILTWSAVNLWWLAAESNWYIGTATQLRCSMTRQKLTVTSMPILLDALSKTLCVNLTLKWPRYFTPVGAQGGTPLKKTTFPPEFCNEICTIYVWTIKSHNSAKKIQNVVPLPNGGQITNFYFASFQFWPKFGKPLSQRNFSLKFGSK